MWQVAGAGEQAPLLAFLKRDEWRCVAFSARLRDGAAARAADPATTLVWVDRGAQHAVVTSALMLTRAGVALPVLDGHERFELPSGDRLCLLFDRFRSRLHSVMGMKPCVLKIEATLGRRPFASIDYHMMTLDLERWRPEEPPAELRSVTVRKAFPEDTDSMFPMQRSYELEEVYLDPRQFEDRRCRSLLRRALREELVYVAEMGGEPVAKAGTNARGFTTDQIGGVFTRKDLRHRGIARLVMSTLIEHIARDKQHACLFVKKDNLPAVRLYLGLGFAIRGDYRISYYGRV